MSETTSLNQVPSQKRLDLETEQSTCIFINRFEIACAYKKNFFVCSFMYSLLLYGSINTNIIIETSIISYRDKEEGDSKSFLVYNTYKETDSSSQIRICIILIECLLRKFPSFLI